MERHLWVTLLLLMVVSCSWTAKIGDVRLKGGYPGYGRVEMYMPGWYTICDTGWDENDTAVVCSQLGFNNGTALCCASVGLSRVPHRITNVACTGEETRLIDCQSSEPRNERSACYSRHYVAVQCYNDSQASAYSEIQIGNARQPSGDVILRYMGIRGRICSDGWGDADARVACREAGYSNGTAYTHYRQWTAGNRFINLGPMWTSQINCVGNEAKLSDCGHVPLGKVRECTSGHHAGAVCENRNMVFRLADNPDPLAGRVEVSIDGVVGGVCYGSFSGNQDADVLCRQLGYAVGVLTPPVHQNITNVKYTTIMKCRGNETNLIDCVHMGWRQTDSRDADCQLGDQTVRCHGPVRLFSFRPVRVHGPLQLFVEPEWIYTCDTDFNEYTTQLACNEMEFPEGRAFSGSAYGARTGGIGSFRMSCRGNETDIRQCIRDAPCTSNRYVSLVCLRVDQLPISKEFTFELTDMEHNKGQVVTWHYGLRGRICPQLWSDEAATVLCRSLGYRAGSAYINTLVGQPRSVVPYMMDRVNCTGNENSLSECQFQTGLELEYCPKQYMAGAMCLNSSDVVQYRLGGGGPNYGRVEVGVDGEWGTVCRVYWSKLDALVLCRQLGFPRGGTPGTREELRTTALRRMWLSHLQCLGTERNLHECPHRGFDTEVFRDPCTRGNMDATVSCYIDLPASTPSMPPTFSHIVDHESTHTVTLPPIPTLPTIPQSSIPVQSTTPTATPTSPMTSASISTQSGSPTQSPTMTSRSTPTQSTSPTPTPTETSSSVSTQSTSPTLAPALTNARIENAAEYDDGDDDDDVNPAAIAVPIVIILIIIAVVVAVLLYRRRKLSSDRYSLGSGHHQFANEDDGVNGSL